jgi:RNA recognition motif-containing protein
MSNRLYVGNLPFHATEDLIQKHFAAAGEVASVQLMIDRVSGQSRGFGFVEMASPEGVKKAIAELNGVELGGRSLRIDVAEERRGGGGGGPRGGGGGGGRGGGGGGGGGGGRRDDRRGGRY